jgi:hypothetical protein
MLQRFYSYSHSTMYIRIADVTIAVTCANPRVAERMAHRYGDLLEESEPSSIFFTLNVEHADGHILLWVDPQRTRTFAILEDDIESSVFFADAVLGHEFFTRHSALSLHAAVIERAGKTGAIIGQSMAGKTTTSLACALLGMHLASDERCILDAGRLYGFPRALTLRSGCRKLLLSQSASGSRFRTLLSEAPGEAEVSLRPSRLFNTNLTDSRLDTIFLLDGFATQAKLTRSDRVIQLPRLMQAAMMRETGIERPARVLRELAQVRIYLLTLGSPHQSAKLIAETLASSNA